MFGNFYCPFLINDFLYDLAKSKQYCGMSKSIDLLVLVSSVGWSRIHGLVVSLTQTSFLAFTNTTVKDVELIPCSGLAVFSILSSCSYSSQRSSSCMVIVRTYLTYDQLPQLLMTRNFIYRFLIFGWLPTFNFCIAQLYHHTSNVSGTSVIKCLQSFHVHCHSSFYNYRITVQTNSVNSPVCRKTDMFYSSKVK